MKCIFCGFAKGELKQNANGLPFMPLYETRSTLSFLSISIPRKEDAHIILIPKNHFESFAEIPERILKDLMKEAKGIVRMIRKSHGGCNILINDGKSAGQYIMHCHIHIIPRDKKDGIKIEVWKPRKISAATFRKLTEKLRRKLKTAGRA